MTWNEIAASPAWKAFWESAEIQNMIEGYRRTLQNAKFDTVTPYQVIQARLNTIEQIQKIPALLAESESKRAASLRGFSAAEDTEADVLSFPPIA